MTILWILLGIVYLACWVFWLGDVSQGALLAVLDLLSGARAPRPSRGWQFPAANCLRNV